MRSVRGTVLKEKAPPQDLDDDIPFKILLLSKHQPRMLDWAFQGLTEESDAANRLLTLGRGHGLSRHGVECGRREGKSSAR